MDNGVHFTSGPPRSGSALLAASLRRSPRLWAGMSGPVASLADELDPKLGAPGLHAVRGAVRPDARQTVLPPDLFARLEADSFRLDPARDTRGVRVV